MRERESVPETELRRISETLNLPETRVVGLFRRRMLQPISGLETAAFRFDKGMAGIEAGTSVFCDDRVEVVQGFPKIQRAMVLDPSIKVHFAGCSTVIAEEKMNGYNVRVTNVGKQLVALTRGGLVCPYTTEKAAGMLPMKFFEDYPELVLCGEIVGPDNPYVPKDIYGIESLDFFVFDIREKLTGKPLPVMRRRTLAEEYGIKSVRMFGEYPITEACDSITGIIKELGAAGREGVVIKDPEMAIPPIKYTSSQSNCADLRHAFRFYNDYGRDFFFSRVVREGYMSVEWDESEDERRRRCQQLGESLLLPLIETIKKKKRGEKITEDSRIRVRRLETVSRFAEHLRQMGIDAIFGTPEPVGNEYLVRIKKINQSTNDKTDAVLSGQLW